MAWAALLLALGCDDDRTASLRSAVLQVNVLNTSADAKNVVVTLRGRSQPERMLREEARVQLTVLRVADLEPGAVDLRVHTTDAVDAVLQSVWVPDVMLVRGEVREVDVDLATGVPPPDEVCDHLDNDHDGSTDEQDELALCAECVGNLERAAADDPRCGNVRCASLDRTELRGTNTAEGDAKSCVRVEHLDLASNRCERIGKCRPLSADSTTCQAVERVLASAGLCRVITGCESGSPVVTAVADGTPCGGDRTCQQGECRSASPDPGCADGTREGFIDLGVHPDIAGCSGGWSVPGVTRDGLVPACGRASGNTGANREGNGCSAADLCAAGWHVCRGRAEVAAKAPGGCGDAVPPGTPDKALLFAVAQHSEMNTVCTDSSGDNDVFGCGNLGTRIEAGKGCAPLDRALASMRAGTCSFNEAEPNLGPWQCPGSDLHEGASVTKKGCPDTSCQYDGRPVGNADKGGVLCCRD